MQGLATVLAGIPLAALLVGPDDRIIAANQGARDMLGQGLEGRHLLTALRQPDVLEGIEATLRDRQPRKITYQTSDSGRDSSFQVHVGYVETSDARGTPAMPLLDTISTSSMVIWAVSVMSMP